MGFELNSFGSASFAGVALVIGVLAGCGSDDGGSSGGGGGDAAVSSLDGAAPPDGSASRTDGGGSTPDGSTDAEIVGDATSADGGPLPLTARDTAIQVEIGEPVEGQLSASAPDGTALTYRIVDAPTSGEIVELDPNTGRFTYQSQVLVAGTDQFTFQVHDGTGEAAMPGTVEVTIHPFNFTGAWLLMNARLNASSCADVSFHITHTEDTLSIGSRRFSCGSSTTTLRLSTMTIQDGELFYDGDSVGTITDSAIRINYSQFASGCGNVSTSFGLSKTLTGYTYSENVIVPCLGAEVGSGDVTYTPTASLAFAESPYRFGTIIAGTVAERTLELVNRGKAPATALRSSAPAAVAPWCSKRRPRIRATTRAACRSSSMTERG